MLGIEADMKKRVKLRFILEALTPNVIKSELSSVISMTLICVEEEKNSANDINDTIDYKTLCVFGNVKKCKNNVVENNDTSFPEVIKNQSSIIISDHETEQTLHISCITSILYLTLGGNLNKIFFMWVQTKR